MGIGSLVRERRLSLGISQRALARRVGVTQAALSHYETGKRPIPPDVAAALAQAMQCPDVLGRYCASCPARLKGVA
jgi:transcriptional regulator with XRE-family HTH domain